ncbi:MAG: GIY-YIG nuclease family protein, partial [Bacteroidia bacterium]|nr:GIY-YIG nuclease family protein [Bacteroidia bacterium]
YILYSTRSNRYYCGQTNDIIIRLQKHNKGDVKSTKSGIPWVLIGYLPSKTRAGAMELEKKLRKEESKDGLMNTMNR